MSLVRLYSFENAKKIIFNNLLSFDGLSFKNETSSTYPHEGTLALGSYRGLPFVTGNDAFDGEFGQKTEIFDLVYV